MSISDDFNKILENHKEVEMQLKDFQLQIAKDKDLEELRQYQHKLQELQKEHDVLLKSHLTLQTQNQELQFGLNEMVFREKSRILELSQRNREVYFQKNKKQPRAELKNLENELDRRIKLQMELSTKAIQDQSRTLQQQLDLQAQKIHQELQELNKNLTEKEDTLEKEINDNYQELKDKRLDEETLQNRFKNSRMEMAIGMGWLNKAGILLILISLGFLAYYAKNSHIRAALIYFLGLIFLILGEWFFKRGKEIFSQSLLGGGVGILYSGVFFSHFLLTIKGEPLISMTAALIFATIITLITLFLSKRYQSETILSLGLLGGFLPFISYLFGPGFQGSAIYLAMVYLFILNAAVMGLSFFRDWKSTRWVSFLLHSPALIYLVLESPSRGIALLYCLLNFSLYLAVILIPRLKLQKTISPWDILLLGLNTLFSAVLVYILIHRLGLEKLDGLTALIFASIFLIFARLVKTDKEKALMEFSLFWGSAITFLLWMIPMQFGMKGVTPGFLIQGLILITLGYFRNFRYLEKAGWVTYWATLGSLIFWMLFYVGPLGELFKDLQWNHQTLRILKELSVLSRGDSSILHRNFILFTLESLIISVLYTPRIKSAISSLPGPPLDRLLLFRYGSVILAYFCLIIETQHLLSNLEITSKIIAQYYDYITLAAASFFSLLFSFILDKNKPWENKVMSNIGFGSALFAVYFWLLILIKSSPFYSQWPELNNSQIMVLILMVLYNLFTIGYLAYRVYHILLHSRGSVGRFPFWMGLILLGDVVLFVSGQFLVETPAMIYGFSFMFLALLYVVIGFKIQSTHLRLLGLITICLSLLILIFPIVKEATQLMKILSFFLYGVLLLIISLVYQNINQRWRERVESRVESED
ncbi:MAG: DUF2339 domain-containing protein [Spirochaetaceae bacterium]|nr:DUF2339 domain-containing protein [Spirochaetaceae bacterium]